jgi:hypothetical protein
MSSNLFKISTFFFTRGAWKQFRSLRVWFPSIHFFSVRGSFSTGREPWVLRVWGFPLCLIFSLPVRGSVFCTTRRARAPRSGEWGFPHYTFFSVRGSFWPEARASRVWGGVGSLLLYVFSQFSGSFFCTTGGARAPWDWGGVGFPPPAKFFSAVRWSGAKTHKDK